MVCRAAVAFPTRDRELQGPRAPHPPSRRALAIGAPDRGEHAPGVGRGAPGARGPCSTPRGGGAAAARGGWWGLGFREIYVGLGRWGLVGQWVMGGWSVGWLVRLAFWIWLDRLGFGLWLPVTIGSPRPDRIRARRGYTGEEQPRPPVGRRRRRRRGEKQPWPPVREEGPPPVRE